VPTDRGLVFEIPEFQGGKSPQHRGLEKAKRGDGEKEFRSSNRQLKCDRKSVGRVGVEA